MKSLRLVSAVLQRDTVFQTGDEAIKIIALREMLTDSYPDLVSNV